MRVAELSPKEIEYICTLEWEPLMIYLEKKYGKDLKDDFVNTITKNMQKGIDDASKKWRN